LAWYKTKTTHVLDGVKISDRKKKRKEAPLGITVQYILSSIHDITQSKDPTTETSDKMKEYFKVKETPNRTTKRSN